MVEFKRTVTAMLSLVNFNSLPEGKKVVTFYSEGESYWPHLEGLVKATLEKTDLSVCYVSSSLQDPGLSLSHPSLKTFYIGDGFIRNYFFSTLRTRFMVLTMPDLENFQIKRSIHQVNYIYVQHSLVSMHMVYRKGAFDHYDTICCAGDHHVDEIRALECHYNLPKKKLIKLGYSRLDQLIKEVDENIERKSSESFSLKTILIAPSWGRDGLIESGRASSLIGELLDDGYSVILRPHPQTINLGLSELEAVLGEYSDYSGFYYEDSVAGQKSLHDSDLMISDWSGAAIEYSFAFMKPVIFCDIPRKINNPEYGSIDIEPVESSIRSEIGLIWDGLSPIAECVERCRNLEWSKVLEVRERYLFNQGCSDSVFVNVLEELK